MPFPMVAVGLIWAGCACGAGLGADGIRRMKQADGLQKTASSQHEQALREFEQKRQTAQRACERHGRYQLTVQRDTLGAWASWLEANQKKVNRLDSEYLAAFDVEMPSLPQLQFEVAEADSILACGIRAGLTGMAARHAALTGVRMAASAGTGAAISGLSGAAAESAALAWLGGGTLASGGGGVAAGTTILGGITVAPALLIAGFTLNAQGHKTQTRAHQYLSNVNLAVTRMQAAAQLLERVRTRLTELRRAITRTDHAATEALSTLVALDFDPALHKGQLLRTAQLMRALRELLNTPVFNEDGSVNADDITINTVFKEAS